MTWTHFFDMSSGGGNKESFTHAYIEAPEAEAAVVFQNRFGHNPHRVSCTCCGEDYSLSEYKTLEQATAYQRDCQWIEDERGWLSGKNRPENYRDGRWIEPDEAIPDGYRVKDSYRSGQPRSLAAYLRDQATSICVIRADEIKPEERRGDLRDQGYVWLE